MKKNIFLTLLALVSLIGTAFAQGGAPQGGGFKMTPEMKKQIQQMREATYKQMTKELKLTPQQVTKMRAVDDKAQAKAMKLMQEPGDRNAKMPKLMAIQKEVMAEYKKFLKPEQFKKLETMMSQRMGGAPGKPKG